MKEKSIDVEIDEALTGETLDDLMIDLAPPPPANVELRFDAEPASESPLPRFAQRPSEANSVPFRSSLAPDGDAASLIERAEWMRTLSDRVDGRHRARLLGVVSRLLERSGDPRHEKLLESALLEDPESVVLLRRARERAARSGDEEKLIERLSAEINQIDDPIERAPREVKLAAALGRSRRAMTIARSLREAHPEEPGFALLSLYVAERLGDPNEIAQALAAAIRAADSADLKARLALRLAHHAGRGGQHPAAKAWAEFAIGADPSSDTAYLLAIRSARAVDDHPAIRANLLAWIHQLKHGELRSALIQWGIRLDRALGGALAIPKTLLEEEQSTSAHRLRAELDIGSGDRQAARDALRRLIRHAGPGEQAPALRDLAILAAMDGDRPLAQRALKEASYLELEGEDYSARLLAAIMGRDGAAQTSAAPSLEASEDPLSQLVQALKRRDLDAALTLARQDRFGDDPALAMLTSSLELLAGDAEGASRALIREVETRPRGDRAGALLILSIIAPGHPDLERQLESLAPEERRAAHALIRLRSDAQRRGIPMSRLAAAAIIARPDDSPLDNARRAIRGTLEQGSAIDAPQLREIFLLASRRAIPDTLFDPTPTISGQSAASDPLIRLAEAKYRAESGDVERATERLLPADRPELRLALAEIEIGAGEIARAKPLLRELLASGAPLARAARILETLSDDPTAAGDWLLALETQLGALSAEELLPYLERAIFELPRRGAFDLIGAALVERHRGNLALLELLESGLSGGPALEQALVTLSRSSAHPSVKSARLLRAAALIEARGDQEAAASLREEAIQAIQASQARHDATHEPHGAIARGLTAIDKALASGDLDSAEARYDALDFDYPDAPPLALRGARILRAKLRNEAAIQALRQLLAREIDAATRRAALIELASLLDDFRGDISAASASLEEALSHTPGDAEILCLLAPMKLKAGARGEARALFHRAIDAARDVILSDDERATPTLEALSRCLRALGLRAPSEMLDSLGISPSAAPVQPSVLALPPPTSATAADLIDASHLEFFSAAQPAFSAITPFDLNALRLQAFGASPELKSLLTGALGGPAPALYQCDDPPAPVLAADPQGRRIIIHSGLLDSLNPRECLFLCLGAIARARLGVSFMDREPPERIGAILNALFHASSAPAPYPNLVAERALLDGASLALTGEDPRISKLARSAPRLPPPETLRLRLEELSLRLALLSTGDLAAAKRALEASERGAHASPSFERLFAFSLSRAAIERRHLLSSAPST